MNITYTSINKMHNKSESVNVIIIYHLLWLKIVELVNKIIKIVLQYLSLIEFDKNSSKAKLYYYNSVVKFLTKNWILLTISLL